MIQIKPFTYMSAYLRIIKWIKEFFKDDFAEDAKKAMKEVIKQNKPINNQPPDNITIVDQSMFL